MTAAQSKPRRALVCLICSRVAVLKASNQFTIKKPEVKTTEPRVMTIFWELLRSKAHGRKQFARCGRLHICENCLERARTNPKICEALGMAVVTGAGALYRRFLAEDRERAA